MTEEAANPNGESLQEALHRLDQLNLPGDALPALRQAQEALSNLLERFPSQEESRLAALYRLSQALGSSLDVEEVIRQVMDAVIYLTQAERGFLVLLEDGNQDWQVRAARNWSQEDLAPDELEFSRTVIRSVLEQGTGVVTTDAQKDPRFARQESVHIYSLRSILCAPLHSRGRVTGVIYVDNRIQSGLFTPADLEMLTAFGAQAAVAIENAHLYTQTDRALAQRVTELETLSKIDQELNAQLDLDRALEITRRWAVDGSRAERARVVLLQEGISPDDEETEIAEGEAWADQLVAAVIRDKSTVRESASDGAGVCLGVPLMIGDQVMGVIAVERRWAFASAEINFLRLLAGRAATAIMNARLYQAVQRANEAKSKFVSVVTHELRVPMTSIKGYTDLLVKGMFGDLNEQQVQFLQVISNNVDRMSVLVSDLSDISRIETGRLRLELNPFSIHSCLAETLDSLRPRIEEKGQELVVRAADDLPEVYADSYRVVQVLTNLLSNAMKYTPKGGRVEVQVEQQDSFVRLAVSDTGIGIQSEEQDRLFTQFFRSEDPLVRDQPGWGLGLHVAKRLVDLMGGEIGVESAPGAGSTFWFTVPCYLELP